MVEAKTVANEIVLELKQFEELTSGTSSGSANVISTHYQIGPSQHAYHILSRALQPKPNIQISVPIQVKLSDTHIKKTRPVYRRLHNLNRSIIPHIHRRISRQRHLRQTKGTRVRILRWTNDLEDGKHGEGHVWGLADGRFGEHGRFTCGGVVCAFGAETHVYVEEGRGVALEPARLECYGSAVYGPFCAVVGGGHAAAWGKRS